MEQISPQPHDLVVIGASAGGVETLRRVVAGLPADLRATVCVVLHIAPGSPSALASILQRAGAMPCRAAVDGEDLRLGEILVAPPDRHLVVEDGRVRLTVGPRENGHRPAVDALFRSAATARNGRVIGVILSGSRDDGSAGLAFIKSRGGLAVVQDPKEAMYGGMPASALANVAVDAIVPSHLVAETVVSLVNGNEPPPDDPPERDDLDPPPEDPPQRHGPPDRDDFEAAPNPGNPKPLAGDPVITVCPECGGVLSELSEAGMPQWECRVGHRYSPESLLDAQAEDVEAAMWAAVRALEDRRILLERMAVEFESRRQGGLADTMRRRAGEAGGQARAVRDALVRAAATSLRELEGDRAAAEAPAGHGLRHTFEEPR